MAFMTKEEMFAKYPRKWLLINEPQTRASDGEVLGGELVDTFDDRDYATSQIRDLRLRRSAVINSIQEDEPPDEQLASFKFYKISNI
jgi:hypothetical protein